MGWSKVSFQTGLGLTFNICQVMDSKGEKKTLKDIDNAAG